MKTLSLSFTSTSIASLMLSTKSLLTQNFPILFLVILLIGGSVINNLPNQISSALINVTNLLNCSDFKYFDLNNNMINNKKKKYQQHFYRI